MDRNRQMIELSNYDPRLYTIQQVAQIQTDRGVLTVDWLQESRKIVCQFQNQIYEGQNEEIGATLAHLLGPLNTLVPSELRIFEGKEMTYGTPKMLADLFGCEWSDYAYDRLRFQCSVYNTNRINLMD
jgi:hypothetical protein